MGSEYRSDELSLPDELLTPVVVVLVGEDSKDQHRAEDRSAAPDDGKRVLSESEVHEQGHTTDEGSCGDEKIGTSPQAGWLWMLDGWRPSSPEGLQTQPFDERLGGHAFFGAQTSEQLQSTGVDVSLGVDEPVVTDFGRAGERGCDEAEERSAFGRAEAHRQLVQKPGELIRQGFGGRFSFVPAFELFQSSGHSLESTGWIERRQE